MTCSNISKWSHVHIHVYMYADADIHCAFPQTFFFHIFVVHKNTRISYSLWSDIVQQNSSQIFFHAGTEQICLWIFMYMYMYMHLYVHNSPNITNSICKGEIITLCSSIIHIHENNFKHKHKDLCLVYYTLTNFKVMHKWPCMKCSTYVKDWNNAYSALVWSTKQGCRTGQAATWPILSKFQCTK